MTDFINKLPAHAASLSLTHNECHNYHQTVAQMVEQRDYPGDSWVSEEQKAKAIEADDYWVLHWYPNTPVGFIVLCAHDLDVLLVAAKDTK